MLGHPLPEALIRLRQTAQPVPREHIIDRPGGDLRVHELSDDVVTFARQELSEHRRLGGVQKTAGESEAPITAALPTWWTAPPSTHSAHSTHPAAAAAHSRHAACLWAAVDAALVAAARVANRGADVAAARFAG